MNNLSDNQNKFSRNYLEYDVVEHCNLKCKGCGHYSPHLKSKFADIDLFEKDIITLSRVLHVKKMRLLGGEPLVHPQIDDFLLMAKRSHISDEVGISTNGLLLHKQSETFFKNIDFIDVSIYPGIPLNHDDHFAHVESMRKKYNFLLNINFVDHFMQIHDEKKSDNSTAEKTYLNCKIAWEFGCHTFKDGVYYKCIKPTIQRQILVDHQIKDDTNFISVDGVKIDHTLTPESLKAYCERIEPLKSCFYCKGTDGSRFEHQQLKFKKT